MLIVIIFYFILIKSNDDYAPVSVREGSPICIGVTINSTIPSCPNSKIQISLPGNLLHVKSDSICEVQLGQTFSLCPSSFINNPYRTDQNTNVSFAIITTDTNLLAAKIPVLNVNLKKLFGI